MRIILADDAVLIREGLAGLLASQGHEVVAKFSDAPSLTEALTTGPDCAADLLITDVRMPPGMADDGLSAALEVRAAQPHLPILVLSQYVAPAYARTLFSSPSAAGTGYLLKERVTDVREFLSSVDMVAGGGVVIDPTVASALVRASSGVETLTAREMEVLGLMARGASNAEIAAALVVTAAAVSKHVSAIFLKLGLPPHVDNRRVRAVLHYLSITGGTQAT